MGGFIVPGTSTNDRINQSYSTDENELYTGSFVYINSSNDKAIRLYVSASGVNNSNHEAYGVLQMTRIA
jgi:hypothetical protein